VRILGIGPKNGHLTFDIAHKPLQRRLAKVKAIHEADLKAGFGRVYLPFALQRKYANADREWGWKMVMISARCRNCWGIRM
jgi:hypothetical protein